MRNTGIRYSSKERMPTVLSEMAELLPPLSGEQLAVLEADLLANGCYAPVIVNEDTGKRVPCFPMVPEGAGTHASAGQDIVLRRNKRSDPAGEHLV